MSIEASQEFVNKFVERQQRAIADLMNKVVLLETQLAMAADKIVALEKLVPEEEKKSDGFESSDIKKDNE
jgi:hypothetical protein